MKKQGKETTAEMENEGAGKLEGAGAAEGGKSEGKPEANEKPEGGEGGEGKPEGAEGKPEAGESGEGGGKPDKPEAGIQGYAELSKPEKPIGDASRWKRLDNMTRGYEIKDRGVIVLRCDALTMAFVPQTKLISDINNGWRIVAG
jgi:hypothetical protein